MPLKRNLIQMSDNEVEVFLAGRHVLNLATMGPNGWPHVVALWYGFYDTKLVFWTFAKSQKVQNIRRDSRVSALIEDGDSYDSLKGVEVEGYASIVDDQVVVRKVGASIFERYILGDADASEMAFLASAPKRVAVIIDSLKIVTWDHSKLQSLY